jgi:hypothetical protein
LGSILCHKQCFTSAWSQQLSAGGVEGSEWNFTWLFILAVDLPFSDDSKQVTRRRKQIRNLSPLSAHPNSFVFVFMVHLYSFLQVVWDGSDYYYF